MKKIKKILIILTCALFLSPFPSSVSARENVTDWYIKDFQSEIKVNLDSTLEITEKITADCGNLSGKHGIFRILPEEINISGKKVKNPVELLSITDFDGNPLEYQEIKNKSYETITWKIGDPNKTVKGENYYQIHYRVKNVIRFGSSDFDELYWNLNGNFWDLEIDNFTAQIIFPEEVNQNNSTVEYYTGFLGGKGRELANFHWNAPNILEFSSTRILQKGEGITTSVIFPKNIFTPYKFSFWEIYGKYFWLLIPFVVFIFCFIFWFKYGKDPKISKTVIAEYEAPGKLSPIETGMLMRSSVNLKNEFVTAGIINLAVKGFLAIKEMEGRSLFFGAKIKDYELIKETNQPKMAASGEEKIILNKIFEDKDVVKISSLKNSFYKILPEIKGTVRDVLEKRGLIKTRGLDYKIAFIVLGIFSIIVSISLATTGLLAFSLFLSGICFLFFGILMPKRTKAGVELNWKIKGFKLFMKTVDKHRAEFYEKENIFEKFLPYAIIFGITDIWVKKMKNIYGQDFYTNYAPAWYIGSLSSFNADSFSQTISELSSQIATSTSAPSSSGSGGGGFSGGGGGGGGGGGW